MQKSLQWLVHKKDPMFNKEVIRRVCPSEETPVVVVAFAEHAPLQNPIFRSIHESEKDLFLTPPIQPGYVRLVGIQPLINGDGRIYAAAMDFELKDLHETSETFKRSERRLAVMRTIGDDRIIDAYTRAACVGCGLDKGEEPSVLPCSACGILRFCKGCEAERRIHRKSMCRALRRA